MGSRLLASQGGRSGQRSVLVQSGGEACLPTAAKRGMAQHRERFAGISVLSCRDFSTGTDVFADAEWRSLRRGWQATSLLESCEVLRKEF